MNRPPRGREAVASARRPRALATAFIGVLCCFILAGCIGTDDDTDSGDYPLHTDIQATTFWVGEILDPDASDGSQVISTYDSQWLDSYGGCDGVWIDDSCETEERSAENDYFPSSMEPLQNPFYLDLPFDDVNNNKAFDMRDDVVPWAAESPYAENSGDPDFSYMKNRWVEISRDDLTCYGQIQDAGPAVYNDYRYVFGDNDQRPESTRWNSAGLDVSPALNACLEFDDLDMTQAVDWRFINEEDVPDGPWTRIVTTSGVQ